jgi:hypothetical protein
MSADDPHLSRWENVCGAKMVTLRADDYDAIQRRLDGAEREDVRKSKVALGNLRRAELAEAKLENATMALRLIQDGPADPGLDGDGAWCSGVAMSALASIEEMSE